MGQVVDVLVEADSKRSDQDWMARNDQNIVVVFPKEQYKKGDFVQVKIERASTSTLVGVAVGYASL